MGIVHTSVIIEEIYTPHPTPCVHFHLPAPNPTTVMTATNAGSSAYGATTFYLPFPPAQQAALPAPAASAQLALPAPAGGNPNVTMVTLSTTDKPKKKILGLRYRDTGHVLPFVNSKGKYVSASTKELIWVPSLNSWVAGPKYRG